MSTSMGFSEDDSEDDIPHGSSPTRINTQPALLDAAQATHSLQHQQKQISQKKNKRIIFCQKNVNIILRL